MKTATRKRKTARKEKRYTLKDPVWLEAFGGGPTLSGERVNENKIYNLSACYAAVRVKSETIASLPAILYKRLKPRGKDRATEHPLYRLIHNTPNGEMTQSAFIRTQVAHIMNHGNAYAEIERDGANRPVAWYPIHPSRVEIKRTPSLEIRYHIHMENGTVVVRPENMLHFAGLGGDGISGYPILLLARESMGLSLATQAYGAKFFGNSALPTIILEHPGQIREDGQKRLRQSWNKAYGGDKQSGTAILEEGMKARIIEVNNDHAQFLESRKFQVAEIARWYGVPPHLIGDLERSTNNNIEHQGLEYVTYGIGPTLVSIEQEMNRKLLSDAERDTYFVEHLVDGLLRGDIKSRYEAFNVARNGGWMNANEIREKENMNPIEGEEGEAYLIQGAMTSIANALNPPDANPPSGDSEEDPATGTRMEDVFRALFIDTADRIVKKEMRVVRVAKSEDWKTQKLIAFEDKFRDAIAPICDGYARALGANDLTPVFPVMMALAKEHKLRALTGKLDDEPRMFTDDAMIRIKKAIAA